MPIFRLNKSIEFPSPELAEPNGLLAIGGDLSVARLLQAYRQGIFPWYNQGSPILWWSPAPRFILFPEEYHLPKRFSRTLKTRPFTVTADQDFTGVIENCAEFRGKNREKTWITGPMKKAYIDLHKLGYAHSIECWQGKKLAGGLYGIALDRVFFGESMFSAEKDASKFALYALIRQVKSSEIRLIDCQVKTEHLSRFGAREIPRQDFQNILARNVRRVEPQKKWRLFRTDKEGISRTDACQEDTKGY